MVTLVSPVQGRGGVRGRRALGEAGQWSLCATRLLLYSVPLVVRDGAIVLAAPLLESDKISFQIVREVKGLLSNVHAKCAVISSCPAGISSNSGRQHHIRTKWSEKGEVRKVSC